MKELDLAVAKLADAQFGLIARRQAYGLGASRSACDRRAADGRWLPTDNVAVFRLPGFERSWPQRLMAAVLAGPAHTVASHRAAAVLHGVREGTPVELTVPGAGHHEISHARVHRCSLAVAHRCVVDGIPSTRMERTLVDLAAVVGENEVEQAVEAALRKGLTTVERLHGHLRTHRHGVARLRRVVERRGKRRPAGSDLEVRFLQLVRAAGMAEPVRQYEVRVGGERYFLDFAYPERRLCIELDGREAHEGEAFQRDRTRQNALVLMGWTVLRFTWADVTERAGDAMALVARALVAA